MEVPSEGSGGWERANELLCLWSLTLDHDFMQRSVSRKAWVTQEAAGSQQILLLLMGLTLWHKLLVREFILHFICQSCCIVASNCLTVQDVFWRCILENWKVCLCFMPNLIMQGLCDLWKGGINLIPSHFITNLLCAVLKLKHFYLIYRLKTLIYRCLGDGSVLKKIYK